MNAQAHKVKIRLGVILVLIFVTGLFDFAKAQNVVYSGSVLYSTGSYFFTEHTNSVYLSNGLSLTTDDLRISLTVPFVIQSSPWISYNPSGGIPTGGMKHGQVGEAGAGGNIVNSMMGDQEMARRGRHQVDLQDTVSYRQSSFSDPSLGAVWRIFRSKSGYTTLNLNGSVKLPLADPQTGFGTGEWDVGAGMSVFQRMDAFFLSADVTYWRLGNMDELSLYNPLSVGVGVGKGFFKGALMGSVLFSGSTKVIDGFDPPANLAVGLGYFVSAAMSLNGNISLGLSESSPAFSSGVGVSVRL